MSWKSEEERTQEVLQILLDRIQERIEFTRKAILILKVVACIQVLTILVLLLRLVPQ